VRGFDSNRGKYDSPHPTAVGVHLSYGERPELRHAPSKRYSYFAERAPLARLTCPVRPLQQFTWMFFSRVKNAEAPRCTSSRARVHRLLVATDGATREMLRHLIDPHIAGLDRGGGAVGGHKVVESRASR